MGLEPVGIPLFEIVPTSWSPPEPAAFNAVAMTSANAARHGGEGLRRYCHLPLFAVGEATAAAAREGGFRDIRIGQGDGRHVAALWGNATVLHLTGLDHAPLPDCGHVANVAVYEARRRELTPGQAAQLRAPFALVHSRRAGTALATLVQERAETTIVAISNAAAAGCGKGWQSTIVAEAPREQAMLESLARLCDMPDGAMKGL